MLWMPYDLHPPAQNRTVGLCVERSWAVHVACANGHGRRWNVAALAEQFAPGVTLEAIAERLVCRALLEDGTECGCRDGALNIFQDTAYTQRRDLEAFEAANRPLGVIGP